jgi:hypothetical protein
VPVNALEDDARGPYGELLFDGSANAGAHSTVAGVGWGDGYKFFSTTNPVTYNSAWTWNTPNTVPYVKLWTTAVDATMGTVQTQTKAQQDAGGYFGTDRWNTTSAAGDACADPGGEAHVMPCSFNWPYQSINYSMGAAIGLDDDTPTNNTRLAWGTNFGFLGQAAYHIHGSAYWGGPLPDATAPGWPKKSYSTFVVLGRHSVDPVGAQVAQIETVQNTALTATIGSVRTTGVAGVNRSDLVTLSPAGWNHVYAAWALQASSNQVDANFNVAAGTLVKPLVIIYNWTAGALPSEIRFKGATLTADVDYFASLRTGTPQLWITLNRDVTGASNRLEVLPPAAPPPPVPTLSVEDVTFGEGNSGTANVLFTVSLSAASADTVTVSYATANGTATAGSDYTAVSGTLSFAPAEVTKFIPVSIIGDTTFEANETFTVNLSNPTNATIADASGTGTIMNDDVAPTGPPPFVTISDFSVAEGNAGQSIAYFNVSLSQPSAQTVTVVFTTSDGTAQAGSDYVARSFSTLTFRPGQTVETAIVTILTDVVPEPNETFVVNLTAASGATITDAQGVGTIVNDDPSGAAVAVPQYRLFNDATHEHLYTTDVNEYNVLGANGWLKEGQAYQMFTSTGSYGGTFVVPLFRLFHPQSQQHLWTTDANEATVLGETPDWIYEGITGYILPVQVGGTTALYRMFLDGLRVHLWTTDQNEYDFLGANGWVKEGAIGYVIP